MRKSFRILLAIVVLAVFPMLIAPAPSRSYVSANYQLNLDGMNAGFLKSVEGGSIYSEVINEAAGPDFYTHKHIGQPKYEDFTLQVGFSMDRLLYDWIAASWQGQYQRKNGEIIQLDAGLKPMSARQFYNALLTEVTIPALDAASKEPGYLTVKFAPEYTRMAKAASTKGVGATAPKGEQKTWLPSNFRVEIDGLECSKINKIEAFTIKQTAVQDSVGEARDYAREPGKLEFPNLKLSVPVSSIDTWQNWFDEFVVQGQNDQSQEKEGALYFLSTDRQTVLAVIRLHNIGIVRMTPDKAEGGSDQIQRMTIELYVERMEFEISSPAKAG